MSPRRPWHFQWDINGDGIFTITDVFKLIAQLFFLPGDSLIYFTINEAPEVARFLELGRNSLHGFLSGIFSLIVWIVFLAILLLIKRIIADTFRKIGGGLSGKKAL